MDIEASIGLRLDGLREEFRKAHEEQQAFNVEMRELARGKKFMELYMPQPSTPTALSIPGPDAGWAWSLKICSGVLTGSDSVSVWKGDTQSGAAGTPPVGGRLIGYTPAPGAAPGQNVFLITWSSNQGIVKDSMPLFLTTSGAFRFSSVYLAFLQIPQERLGVLS